MSVAVKLIQGIVEIGSLALFAGMIWLWAALAAGPGV